MFRKSVMIAVCLAAVCMTEGSTTRFKGYGFESYVTTDMGYRYNEELRNHGRYVQVSEGDEYSLVVNNPLPVRVAVAVTIDGLNVIDGKRTSPDAAQKWIIEANSSLTLRGWQTGRSALRRFVFTDKNESYAQWKGQKDNKAYTRNLGVIGAAYFWNSAELNAVLHPPVPFSSRDEECMAKKSASAGASASRSAPACEAARPQAGTGMGRTETNNVIDVEFHYDTGMYRAKDVVAIYYEFAQVPPRPQPFTDDGKFTPEMN